MGGASIANDSRSTVTVAIASNDNAAGTVGFGDNSRAATIMEGQSANLNVARTFSQLGEIRAYWTIESNGSVTPASQFNFTSGSVTFSDGQDSGIITIVASEDFQPELSQTFTVNLTSVEAVSSDVGEPSLDPTGTTSILIIQSSDDPFGLLLFVNFEATVAESTDVTVVLARQISTLGKKFSA